MYNAKKNQIIITALVIMIIIAGYINYNDKVEETMSDNIGINHEVYEVNTGLNEELAFDPVFELPDTTIPTNADGANGDEDESQNEADNEENDDVNMEESNKDDTDQPGAAVLVDSSAVVSSHFSQLRLEREQMREKTKDNIYDVINSSDVSQEAKADAAQRMLDLNDRMMHESQLEAIIIASGFNQVYVSIGEDTVDVIVDKQELSEQDIAKIINAVERKTKMGADKIYIRPFRTQN